MVLPQVDQIQDRDRIRPAVANVSELTISLRNIRKAAPPTARVPQKERTDRSSSESFKRKSEGRGHCSESIEAVGQLQAKGVCQESF
jgi:hypothetical protein